MNGLWEASNEALSLSLRLKRMRAVAECFADCYVDVPQGAAQAVSINEAHYENLFNALFDIMVTADQEAAALAENLDKIHREAKEHDHDSKDA